MSKYIKDNYREFTKKKTISVQIPEEMYYWLQRLAELNGNQDREDNTLQRVTRTALFMHLKHRLPNNFSMTKEQFLRSNERTGLINNNEKW